MSAKPVELWSSSEVLEYLHRINLDALVPKFKEHEIKGEDLVMLTESEMKADIGITKLQARRIKKYLFDGGASYNKDATEDAAPHISQPAPGATTPTPAALTEAIPALNVSGGSFSRLAAAPQPTAPPAAPAGYPPMAVPAGYPPIAQGIPVSIPVPAAPPVMVDPAIVRRYDETIALIHCLEGEAVAVKLPAAKEALGQLQRRLGEEHAKFSELQGQQEKAQKKADALEEGEWYPGKYLLGKKRNEKKVAGAKQVAEEAARKVVAAAALLEKLHAQEAAQKQAVAHLTAKVSQLQEAKRWEEAILPQVFAGVAGDAQENALEREVDGLAPQLQQVRQYKVSYSKAYELTKAARKQMQGAQELLRSAFGLAGLDVAQDFFRPAPFQNSMGGVMVDAMKRAHCRQATQLVAAGCGAIVRAKEIIPDMPRVELKNVKALQGIGFMDMVFDNMVSDMMARQKIRKAVGQVDGMLADIHHAERWLEGWLQKVEGDLRGLEQRYATTKQQLDGYRRSLMHQMAQAQLASQLAQAQATVPVAVEASAPPPPPSQANQYPSLI
mmetsp:Transcript_6746/g.14892  ORF Transcript_6746/g.14892 Transcript_6746/m.14892 type:complete len:556 (-) Transcript_6746:180-1847(-)|eukprot:CAMPEP_0202897276 /NCGR_PEP_ID=MMETSP1392-20130828/6081_1 /ASSEMBLY_ACC=CAM_ASM_000868 /TAXON_ID=225041 /ORGANISM="Chlamydomonas chlamydogama, Strain SAG 11-48b" /LENGTH=555 /DNA_ID=CAMNT_0049582875 /DNA_START=25 /DNA_END=1692 /DNA_ORIENTATION=+